MAVGTTATDVLPVWTGHSEGEEEEEQGEGEEKRERESEHRQTGKSIYILGTN